MSEFSDPVDDETSPCQWPHKRSVARNKAVLSRLGMKKLESNDDEKQLHYLQSLELEVEMMKERFAKLLLGEDMSWSGKGSYNLKCHNQSLGNPIWTQFEVGPLNPEKKALWKREMDCLLSVCIYIVEFTSNSYNLRNGVEVLESRPRSDIYVNLPALRKLDSMLIEILDSFEDREIWYAEEGSLSLNSIRTGSFRRVVQRNDEKWWVPVPCVPPCGLSEKARKHLQHKRDCANQIHKAAMAINGGVLAEMEIPDSYVASLPKSGRDSIGDPLYKFMHATEKFFPDYLLDCLNIADHVEASMYTWRRKARIRYSKSSWGMVKELMSDVELSDKNHIMADRAESLLFALKQRYPELSQTSLDTCKIQHNRNVGQATLESYSRVLEGLAFNIVAWIEDVFFVDNTIKGQN